MNEFSMKSRCRSILDLESQVFHKDEKEEKFDIHPYWLVFIENSQQEQFNRTIQQESSRSAYALLACLDLFLCIFEVIPLALIHHQGRKSDIINYLPAILSFVLFLYSMYLFKERKVRVASQGLTRKKQVIHQYVRRNEQIFAVLTTTAMGLIVLLHSFMTNCHSDNLFGSSLCEHSIRHPMIVQYGFAVLVVTPLFLEGALTSLIWPVVCLCWLIAIVFLLIIVSLNEQPESFFFLFILVLYLIAAMYFRRYKQLATYRILHSSVQEKDRHMRQDLECTRRKIVESDAEEWRFIIANMAHDVQTPLAAFRTGCDYISSVLTDLAGSTSAPSLDMSRLNEDVLSGLASLQSLQHTCSYMQMIISRVLDYAKASRGLQLVPHAEAVDLLDCLAAPLACLRDLQSKLALVVEPLPPNVRRIVRTDPKWLQESILCLVSNAVKYSMNKPATLRIYLVQRATVDGNEDSISEMKPQEYEFSTSRVRKAPSVDFEYHLCFEVEDNGVGVREEMQEKIFEPFSQAQRTTGGMGLGLFSLSVRMKALKGSCGVTSRRDGKNGARFWFAIPYYPVELNSYRSLSATSSNHNIIRRSSTAVSIGPQNTPQVASSPPTYDHSFDNDNNNKSDEIQQSEETAALIAQREAEQNIRCSTPIISEKVPVDNSKSVASSPVVTSLISSPAVAEAAESKIASPSSPRSKVDEPQRQWRVLIVDDSLPILKMARRLLEKDGHVAVTAENGYEALIALSQDNFDILVMDLQMPIMDGFETVRRIRFLEKQIKEGSSAMLRLPEKTSSPTDPSLGPVAPIIDAAFSITHQSSESAHGSFCVDVEKVMEKLYNSLQKQRANDFVIIGCSANGDEGTIQEAYNAGIDAFIPKPINLKVFKEVTAGILAKRFK